MFSFQRQAWITADPISIVKHPDCLSSLERIQGKLVNRQVTIEVATNKFDASTRRHRSTRQTIAHYRL